MTFSLRTCLRPTNKMEVHSIVQNPEADAKNMYWYRYDELGSLHFNYLEAGIAQDYTQP